MDAVLRKEFKDSRYLTLGMLLVFILGGVFETNYREMYWIMMRMLLLPVAVGILGARFMGAESDEERIHLLTLPLPFPGLFGLRLMASLAQASILVSTWFMIEHGTFPNRELTAEDLMIVGAVYALIFMSAAWVSLYTGSTASSCSIAFFGAILLYWYVSLFGPRPHHQHAAEAIIGYYGILALSFLGLLLWVSRQDGLDMAPRHRIFWLGLLLQALLIGAISVVFG